MRSPLRLAMSSLGRRKLDQETATKKPEQNFGFCYFEIEWIGTCWNKIEQEIFLPLPLHLDPEPGGRDPLPRQLDQEVLLLHWPNL